jgi:hypothetical protein
MSDDRRFQKKLAKLQIEATMMAVMLGIIISLGVILISFSMSMTIKEVIEIYRNSGIVIIFIGIGMLILVLKSYYRSIDRIDKGSQHYS